MRDEIEYFAELNARARKEERRAKPRLVDEAEEKLNAEKIEEVLKIFDDLSDASIAGAPASAPRPSLTPVPTDEELGEILATCGLAEKRKARRKDRRVEEKRDQSEKAWALSSEIAGERKERRAAYMRHISKGAPRELRRHASPAAVDDLMAWWTAIAQVKASGRALKVRFIIEARQKIQHSKVGDDGRYALKAGLSSEAIRSIANRMLALVEKLETEGGPWHGFAK